jgi:hypothetical protein
MCFALLLARRQNLVLLNIYVTWTFFIDFQMNRNDLSDWADLIERFLTEKNIGDYEWDDHIQAHVGVPLIDAIRMVCGQIHRLYPGTGGAYCSDEGMSTLRELKENIRKGPEATQFWIKNFCRQHKLPFDHSSEG